MPELRGMSRLRSGQSTLDACLRPFHRTTLPLRLRTQELAAALSPGMVPSTIRTSKDRVGTLVVDSIGVGMAAFGFLNPLLAALIHVTSELAFILNSTRLLPRGAESGR
jgi:hypothetical protein